MEVPNALWFSFICAGLACIPTIALLRRSRLSSCYLRSCFSLKERSARATGLSPSPESGRLLAPVPALPTACRIARAISVSLKSCCSSVRCDWRSISSPTSSMCSSVAGSAASSPASSRSCSSRSDSGAESDSTRGSVTRLRSSCGGNGQEAASPPSMLQEPRKLRSALRSSAGSPAGLAMRKSKSVTFKEDADGVVFCTPPTATALSMLAAGAPAVQYRPAAPSPASAASLVAKPAARCTGTSGSPAAAPATPQPRVTAVATVRAAPNSNALRPATAAAAPSRPASASASASAPSPETPAALPPRPHTAQHPSSRPDRQAAAPPTSSPRRDPFFHDDVSSARQRLMAAMAEAKARHAHLGTTTTADNWPMPPEADEPWRREREEQERRDAAERARRIANRAERLVAAPVLLVTERDAEILKVTYASLPSVAADGASASSAAAAAAPLPPRVCESGVASAPGEDWRACAGSSSREAREALKKATGASASGSSGSRGSSCAALLREVVAERMRLAEAMVAQASQPR